jgi:allantoicase
MTDALRSLPDLAGRALGGAVVWSNDEFYGQADRLLVASPPTHDPLVFDTRGKVYDGWETRRRREPGDDATMIRLAVPGVIRGVDVDTSFFTGNAPTHASVEGTVVLGYPTADELQRANWTPLVSMAPISPDSANLLAVDGPDGLCTHVRLTIRPDGGVARFRAYGEAMPDPRFLGGVVDLASTVNGGRITGCSNMFYSSPANILAPGRAPVMSDGWETARRRDDGNDWLVVSLGARGVLHDVVIDTLRFIGNAPGAATLSDADSGAVLLDRTSLLPDTEHRFRIHVTDTVANVRLDIFPDGGISRLRLHGEIVPQDRTVVAQRWLDLLPPAIAAQVPVDEFFG